MYYVYVNFGFPWSEFKKVSVSENLTDANSQLHDWMNATFPGVWDFYQDFGTNASEIAIHIDGYEHGHCKDKELKYSLGFVSNVERDYNQH